MTGKLCLHISPEAHCTDEEQGIYRLKRELE